MQMHKLERRRQFFKSFEAKSLRNRSHLVRLADDLTSVAGSPTFLFLNVYFFAIWIGINSGLISWITPFDPYPYGFLTMIVSLEAIILSIFILVSQNRSAYINTLRDEVHLQINMAAEREITKILEVLADIRHKLGIMKTDPELQGMLEQTDAGYIEQRIIEQLSRANKPLLNQMISEFPHLRTAVKKSANGEKIKEEEVKNKILTQLAK